jgi:LCP family protein required for cell wall assembly
MIATLDQATNEVKLTSIYRDTYVEIPGRGLDKINHAYAYGGPALLLSTINTNLDLNITEFVAVNFDSLVNSVDAVGGIDMYISSDEVKYINGYINAIAKSTGIETENITKEGQYHLNGVQALAYSRIRYTEGWDYKRTERQRVVLSKMLEKAKTMNSTDLIAVVDTMLPMITTNISKDEIRGKLLEINKYSAKEGIGWPYNVRGYTGSAWYGAPVTLESNVKRLHKEVFREEDYTPTAKVKEISKKIINKTGYSK